MFLITMITPVFSHDSKKRLGLIPKNPNCNNKYSLRYIPAEFDLSNSEMVIIKPHSCVNLEFFCQLSICPSNCICRVFINRDLLSRNIISLTTDIQPRDDITIKLKNMSDIECCIPPYTVIAHLLILHGYNEEDDDDEEEEEEERVGKFFMNNPEQIPKRNKDQDPRVTLYANQDIRINPQKNDHPTCTLINASLNMVIENRKVMPIIVDNDDDDKEALLISSYKSPMLYPLKNFEFALYDMSSDEKDKIIKKGDPLCDIIFQKVYYYDILTDFCEIDRISYYPPYEIDLYNAKYTTIKAKDKGFVELYCGQNIIQPIPKGYFGRIKLITPENSEIILTQSYIVDYIPTSISVYNLSSDADCFIQQNLLIGKLVLEKISRVLIDSTFANDSNNIKQYMNNVRKQMKKDGKMEYDISGEKKQSEVVRKRKNEDEEILNNAKLIKI